MKRRISFIIIFLFLCIITGCSINSKYSKGKKLFEDGNYEEAAKVLSEAIAEKPTLAEYYIDYGLTLIALGHYEDAAAQFEQADKNNTEKENQNTNTKLIFRGRGMIYYYQKQYQAAVEEFDQALLIDELSEADMEILYYKASALTAAGSYEQAVQTYTDILSQDSEEVSALSDRAEIYHRMGDFDKSLADYEKAISLTPNEYDNYFGKYYLMLDNGKEKEAAEVLKKAADIKGKSDEKDYNRAKINYYQGEYDLALTELSKSLDKGFVEANYFIGEIYRLKEEYKTAVTYYETFIREGTALTPIAYNQLGFCMIKLGDYGKAIEYLEQGIAFQHAETMRILKKNEIIAYEMLGWFQEAKNKLEEYRMNYPDDLDAEQEAVFVGSRLTK